MKSLSSNSKPFGKQHGFFLGIIKPDFSLTPRDTDARQLTLATPPFLADFLKSPPPPKKRTTFNLWIALYLFHKVNRVKRKEKANRIKKLDIKAFSSIMIIWRTAMVGQSRGPQGADKAGCRAVCMEQHGSWCILFMEVQLLLNRINIHLFKILSNFKQGNRLMCQRHNILHDHQIINGTSDHASAAAIFAQISCSPCTQWEGGGEKQTFDSFCLTAHTRLAHKQIKPIKQDFLHFVERC